MIRAALHIVLHFLLPAAVAATAYREQALKAWLIMMATILIDIDHLLANPVYDPDRCSIGFHPLHQYPLIAVYGVLMIWPRTRLPGIGLSLHMFLDGVDCLWMSYA